MYNNDELKDLMELFIDEDYLEEGFFDKLKEKKAEKKAAKAEKRAQKEMDSSVIISEKELPRFEKEFNDTVKFIVNLLKKEVPGANFINTDAKNASRRVNKIKDGVEEHILSLKIFQMDDNNYDKYKSKSKYKELRDSENAWDYMDELLQDNCTRIADPIEAKGFENIYNDNSVMSKKKGDKDYLQIILGDEATFDIDVYMHFIVQKELIEESCLEFDWDDVECIEEGLFDKLKEKRAEKKARKEEEKEMRRQKEEEEKAARKAKNDERKARQATEYLNKFVMYKASEEESGPKKDLADLANNVKAILKKEIPGCTFVGNKAKHKTTKLDKGCVLHEYSLIIFRMDEDNKKRFVKNTNDLSLKTKDTARRTADTAQKFGRVASMATGNYGYNTTDMIKGSVDMLTGDIDKLVEKDFIRRIQDPIIDMGFTGKRNAYIKEKNGMEYLGVKIEGKYSEYEIVVKVRYIIKPNDYVEESFEPVEELFGFGNKYKNYSDEELKKERDRYAGIIGNTNKPNEIRKNYKELNKINKELEGRNKVNKIVGDKGQNKGKEYDGNKVRNDVRKIWQDVQRLMKSNSDIKPFNDNGMFMHSMNDIYDLSDKDAGVYEAGVDEFLIVGIDLWDYKGGNPRQIIADSDDGWHPVNHAEEKLRKLISELLEKKYPDFKVLPYGGDWDTGDITIGLR